MDPSQLNDSEITNIIKHFDDFPKQLRENFSPVWDTDPLPEKGSENKPESDELNEIQ